MSSFREYARWAIRPRQLGVGVIIFLWATVWISGLREMAASVDSQGLAVGFLIGGIWAWGVLAAVDLVEDPAEVADA